MKEFINNNKRRLIVIITLAVVFLILSILKRITWISEYIFARGISRFYGLIIGKITSIIPISIFELSIIAAIILGIIFLIRTIKRLKHKEWKTFIKSSLNLIIIVITILLVYTMTASINYYRMPVELNVYSENVDKEEIMNISEYFLNDFNSLSLNLSRDLNGNIINPYTDRQLAKIMREEFERLNSSYYNNYVPLVKPIIFSTFMSYNRICGVSFQPTAEPNINRNMPSFSKPFTMAHEIAHSIGVMREDEANLIATYITLSSKNDFIRYSGYISTFFSITEMVRYSNGYTVTDEFYSQINDNIINDYDYIYEYWSQFNTIMNGISTFFNDLYLKLQGQKDGIESYNNSYEYEIIDNGETNDYGEVIFEVIFSDVQRVYFTIYYNN